MPSDPAGVSAGLPDDSFELYDLRVEVVCPEGERMMCGAKKGDYFTLEGEMMYLPPGQGISIYSLGKFDACLVVTGQPRRSEVRLTKGQRPSFRSSQRSNALHIRTTG